MSKIKKYFQQYISYLYDLIDHLPYFLLIYITLISCLLISLLLIGAFTRMLLFGGLLVALVVAIIFTRKIKNQKSKNKSRWVLIIAMIFISLWGVWNLRYTSEDLFVYRDPAAYAVTGAWLTGNNDLNIIKENSFSDVEGVKVSSAGFYDDDGGVSAHGQHLLPALMGVFGRITSNSAAFKINVLLTMLFLLMIFCLARYFMPQYLALALTIIFAFTPPVLYFSRNIYTEPLMGVFSIGALLFILHAIKYPSSLIWILSGLTMGAAFLTRIDAFIGYVGIFIGLSFFAIFSKKKKPLSNKQLADFFIGLTIPLVLGVLDLYVNSKPYFEGHKDLIFFELIAMFFSIVLFMTLTMNVKFKKRLSSLINSKRFRKIAVLLFSVAIVAIVLRPLWYSDSVLFEIVDVGGRSVPSIVQGGEAVREESTVQWLTWYVGLPVVLLGLVGAIKLLSSSLKKRNGSMLILISFFSSAALIYLIKPSIGEDQIWAARRFLPIVLPLCCIIAFTAFYELIAVKKSRVIIVATGFLLVLSTFSIFKTNSIFMTTREDYPRLSQVKDVCSNLPKNSIVFWEGILGLELTQTSRSYCSVESYAINKYDSQFLKEIYSRTNGRGYVPVIGVADFEEGKLGIGNSLMPLPAVTTLYVDRTVGSFPEDSSNFMREIRLGLITEIGKVVPLNYTPQNQ